ncbi:hypothetical protein CPB86DRAFT_461255 [Serendipita vermifera]|nr:hypothetical protein CPB86DRAFT_461255 [Serendipita vermifera]
MVAITSRVIGLLVLSATLSVAHPEPVDLEERNNGATTFSSSRHINATTVTASFSYPTSFPSCNYTEPPVTCYCAPTSVPTTVTTIVVPHPTTITLTVPAPYPYPNGTVIPSSIPSSLVSNGTVYSSSRGTPTSRAKATPSASTITVPTSFAYPTVCNPRPTIYVYGDGNYTEPSYPISSVFGNITTIYFNGTYPTPEPTYN